jgi:hypothetical protein
MTGQRPQRDPSWRDHREQVSSRVFSAGEVTLILQLGNIGLRVTACVFFRALANSERGSDVPVSTRTAEGLVAEQR